MKNSICTCTAVIGTLISGMFGGWDSSLTTLLIFMGIDFVTGLIVSGVYKKSPKTETGKLKSGVCLKGLVKKGMILGFVLIGHRLDLMTDSNYIRDGICIAFIVNELIIITENADIIGIPVPQILINAIDNIKTKNDKGE